jgi:hypothetical protein
MHGAMDDVVEHLGGQIIRERAGAIRDASSTQSTSTATGRPEASRPTGGGSRPL